MKQGNGYQEKTTTNRERQGDIRGKVQKAPKRGRKTKLNRFLTLHHVLKLMRPPSTSAQSYNPHCPVTALTIQSVGSPLFPPLELHFFLTSGGTGGRERRKRLLILSKLQRQWLVTPEVEAETPSSQNSTRVLPRRSLPATRQPYLVNLQNGLPSPSPRPNSHFCPWHFLSQIVPTFTLIPQQLDCRGKNIMCI